MPAAKPPKKQTSPVIIAFLTPALLDVSTSNRHRCAYRNAADSRSKAASVAALAASAAACSIASYAAPEISSINKSISESL
jgi:hypothetical protein